ncbi:CD33 isoform 1 [Pongo abelii]|uniref:CD33 isoform 1 n=1 Tax=Pongo abelii TaxID=9601 RepID=A0A2J8U9C3_PONAB|nr:CD33 isoform 1 [Pongo abelii]
MLLLLLLPLLWADLTHRPKILIPGALDPGHSKNLTCSVPWACEQGTPPIFSWLSAAPTSLGPRTTHSSVLIITPRPQDHGTNLICQVKFPGAGVTTERIIQLNVTYAPQNPTTGIFLGDGSGKQETRAGVVHGAIGGAGITALLALCLCLIFFIVKTHRRKAARTAVGRNDTHSATGPASPVSDGASWHPVCPADTSSQRGPQSCPIQHFQN